MSVVAFRSYFFESVKSWECQRQPLCTSFVGTSAARANFGWLCCLANICPRTSFTFHFGSQICSEHGAVPKASCVHHAFGFEGAAGAMCLGKSSYQTLSCDLKWIWRRLCVLRFLDYFISASALIVLSGCSAKATSHHIKSPYRLSLSASQTKNTERKAKVFQCAKLMLFMMIAPSVSLEHLFLYQKESTHFLKHGLQTLVLSLPLYMIDISRYVDEQGLQTDIVT